MATVDINWETLTGGPDGKQLEETIREFIATKFQNITLPRFIRSVQIHSFEFGTVAPELQIIDVCDPLPDFYEENDQDMGEEGEQEEEGRNWQENDADHEAQSLRERRRIDRASRMPGSTSISNLPPYIETRRFGPGSSHIQTLGEVGSPLLGANTPGISGGTSNLNYFHSQFASGFSGTQTPLAAVAGAHLPHGWPDYSSLPSTAARYGHRHSESGGSLSPSNTAEPGAKDRLLRERASVSTLATSMGTNTTRPQTRDGMSEESIQDEEPLSPPPRFREPRVEDLQTVFRVQYSGDIKLSLTAEILLDYPMPSFVGIPLKLNVVGVSFDGVAVLAYIRKRAHFCFLSPEDAYAAIGPEALDGHERGRGLKMGGLLQEIKVESEIGQRENGKQVLKNVGKVEKFVLEQVRRIFEDEFVYPSFWTFLV